MHINYMTMWNDLSLKEKSSIMKDFVKRGYRDLASIEKDYNIFAEGGIPEGKEVRVQEEESLDMASWTKEDLMKKLYYDENGVPRNKETGEYVPLSTPNVVVTPKNNIYRTADRLTWEDLDKMANDAEAPLAAINSGAWGVTLAYPNPVTPWIAGVTSTLGTVIDGYQLARDVVKGDYTDAAVNGLGVALSLFGKGAQSAMIESDGVRAIQNATKTPAARNTTEKAIQWMNDRGEVLEPVVKSATGDLIQDVNTVFGQPSFKKEIHDLYAFGGGLKSPFSHSPIPAVRY